MIAIKNKSTLIITFSLALFLTSCMPSFNIKKDAGVSFKNKSIAVLAATVDKETVTLCNAINKELKKQTSFNVLTTEEIKKLFPEYPQKVRGPYKFAFTEIDDDYKLTDIDRVNDIKKKLNVDIVIFFWCPSKIVSESGKYFIIMQGFAKNKREYFAYGKYRIKHSGKGELLLGAPDSFDEMIKSFSKKFAKVIGEKTDTLKK